MKIRILLTIIGAVALAAITFNVNAGNVLLTPRDGGNQTKIAPGISDAQSAVVAQTAAPRAAGNQTATVAGKETTAIKCSAIGSPKYQALAGNEARTSCCGQTLAACPNMSACASAK